MARPREFDEADVLDRAIEVFWSRGYEGTSIDDLIAATGLARASLYGAFGDKAGLFSRALDHYVERAFPHLASLENAVTIRDSLYNFVQDWIENACPQKGPRGCFLLFSGIVAEEGTAPAEMMRQSRERTEQVIEQAIERGQKSKELPATISARRAAEFLSFALQGVAVGARSGRSRADLERLGRAAVDAALAQKDDTVKV